MLLKKNPLDIIKSILAKRKNPDKVSESLEQGSINRESLLERIQYNNKVFSNKLEQLAYIQYIAATKLKDTEQLPLMNEDSLKLLIKNSKSTEDFYNKLSNYLINPSFIDVKRLAKHMGNASIDCMRLKVSSPELLLWRSITSSLYNRKNPI